ncbi:MAG: hypothetical protein ACP5OO_06890 [Chloroflexia bacterium]
MAEKLSREKIQRELSKHLQEGENLLVWGYATLGLKNCYLGLTDRRLLVNERTIKDEDKALEEVLLADIAEVRVKKPFVLPLDQYLLGLLIKRRHLEIRTHSGRHLTFILQRWPQIQGNETVAESILAELQARIPGLRTA